MSNILFEKGQILPVHIEQVDAVKLMVRLSDGSAGVIPSREWLPDNPAQPSAELFKVGTPLRAMLLRHYHDSNTWELSLRRAHAWDQAARRFEIGARVRGRVVNVASERAYVQLLPDVDALLPVSEVPLQAAQSFQDAVWIDDDIIGIITHFNPDHSQLMLSVKDYLAQVSRLRSEVRARVLARQKATRELDIEALPAIQGAPAKNRDQMWLNPGGAQSIRQILIIDDDADFYAPFAARLRQTGYEVDIADDRSDGLEKAVSNAAIDLAFLDVNLAGSSGVQLAHDILSIRPGLPIVMVTAGDLLSVSPDFSGLNIVDVLYKPLDWDEVDILLQGVSAGRWARRNAQPTFTRAPAAEEQRHLSTFQGPPWHEQVQATLAQLTRATGATCALLLEMNLDTERVKIMGQSASGALNTQYDWNQARFSPIRDVMRSQAEILESDAQGAGAERRFRNLLPLCSFTSFMGLPVPQPRQTFRYGLFLFHPVPGHFTLPHGQEARLAARSLALSLERRQMLETLQASQPFVLAGQLSVSLTHEINNQLAGLEQCTQNFAGVIQTLTPAQPLSAPTVDDLHVSLKFLSHINDELRELVRFYLGLVRSEEQVFELSSLLNELSVRLRRQARDSRVVIATQFDARLKLRTERARLQQACLNVMLNAVQQIGNYSRDGGLLVVQVHLDKSAERYPIKITFEDDGPGIHRRMVEQVFALGVSTRKEGTGLGLFACRNLIESLGGIISVKDSVLFAGSRLVVELPASLLEGETHDRV